MIERVYLDWNATAPPHADVLAAMAAALADTWGNPSSVHRRGREARQVVDNLRDQLAQLLGAHPRDVIFTSGGTEANNLALSGAMGLALSRIEHPSVTRVADTLEARGGRVAWFDVDAAGVVDLDSMVRALDSLPGPATLVVMAANHETGVIQPLAEARRIADAHEARLHVDAVQLVGRAPLTALRHAHSLAVSSHKVRGPKGLGALIWRTSPAELRPILVGGAQERGLRAGTLDPVAAAGLLAALRRLASGPERYAALGNLRDGLESALVRYGCINGLGAPRLPHVSNLSFNGTRGDELVVALDLMGVEVSSGSACSAGSQEASPVIMAMAGDERAKSAVRVSLGETTTRRQIEIAIDAFHRALARHSSSS